jgi:FkbM family methyltransferase
MRAMSPAALLRRALWEVLHRVPERALTARTKHGVLSFSNKDRAIGRLLFTDREFELDKISRALRCAINAGVLRERNDGWLVDVGANVGSVCIPLVQRGVVTGALAFEPEPKNYAHLVRSLALNGIDARTIRPLNAAVSSTNGTAALELAFTNFGDHRIRVEASTRSHPDLREAERAVITVVVHRLDDVVAAQGIAREDVRLLWIDAQGHEGQVLEGAPKLIGAGVPVVTEFWPYGLARSGEEGRRFGDVLRARFQAFYDLSDAAPQRQPIADVGVLFARYPADPGTAFTDLLLIPA